MESTLNWLNKRMEKMKAQKKKEASKASPDILSLRITGTRMAVIKQVIHYIKTHEK